MTNGEKFKETFPDMKITLCDFYVRIMGENSEFCNAYPLKWWNAEYEESTTKNGLEVDCIKKFDAINIIQDMHGLARADVISDAVNRIITMPSVTPQGPRKGHWILTDVEGDRVWYCHCSECGKDPQKYIGGSENWWLIKNKLPEFCPCCGSDNREVKK